MTNDKSSFYFVVAARIDENLWRLSIETMLFFSCVIFSSANTFKQVSLFDLLRLSIFRRLLIDSTRCHSCPVRVSCWWRQLFTKIISGVHHLLQASVFCFGCSGFIFNFADSLPKMPFCSRFQQLSVSLCVCFCSILFRKQIHGQCGPCMTCAFHFFSSFLFVYYFHNPCNMSFTMTINGW